MAATLFTGEGFKRARHFELQDGIRADFASPEGTAGVFKNATTDSKINPTVEYPPLKCVPVTRDNGEDILKGALANYVAGDFLFARSDSRTMQHGRTVSVVTPEHLEFLFATEPALSANDFRPCGVQVTTRDTLVNDRSVRLGNPKSVVRQGDVTMTNYWGPLAVPGARLFFDIVERFSSEARADHELLTVGVPGTRVATAEAKPVNARRMHVRPVVSYDATRNPFSSDERARASPSESVLWHVYVGLVVPGPRDTNDFAGDAVARMMRDDVDLKSIKTIIASGKVHVLVNVHWFRPALKMGAYKVQLTPAAPAVVEVPPPPSDPAKVGVPTATLAGGKRVAGKAPVVGAGEVRRAEVVTGGAVPQQDDD